VEVVEVEDVRQRARRTGGSQDGRPDEEPRPPRGHDHREGVDERVVGQVELSGRGVGAGCPVGDSIGDGGHATDYVAAGFVRPVPRGNVTRERRGLAGVSRICK
jgi:hypothetical protein